jgi:tetratricopeptide (TPR) repeat protein
LAQAYVQGLADATQGLPLCLRLLRAFPGTAEAVRGAPLLFRCHEALGTLSVAYADLEAAASLLGDAAITAPQALALAEAAAAASKADTALAWLDRAGGTPADGAWQAALAAGCLRVGRQLRAVGAMEAALEALGRGSGLEPSAPRAQVSLEAARLLWEMGRHAAVPDMLLRAFIDEADTETLRGAARLMAAGRLSRRERGSYDVARVHELVRFGFHASAAILGEQLLTDHQAPPARIRRVKEHLVGAYDALVAYHLAREDLPAARATVTRWLRIAESGRDLGRALECLATCQELAGEGEEALTTLSRIVAECPGSPQAATARQRLLEEHIP